MKPVLTVRQTSFMGDLLKKIVHTLNEKEVLIGVPAEKNPRKTDDDGLNNAELSYIHEFGTEDGRIPPRPHLIPGIKKAKDQISCALKEAAEQACLGDTNAAETGLEKAGLLGQNAVRATFVDNDWPPLAESTLTYKPKQKNDLGEDILNKKGQPVRGKSRLEQGKTNPLLLTGQLRNAHTYVVRTRGDKGEDSATP